ncbi:MAG TPA: serine/threonine protein kinase [Microcoleaceae bacterium UBA11344]|nr:serine/threonine protein kinase [Microcoleaceae cyanobacterium UBA11344]
MQGKILGGRYKIIRRLGGGGFGQTYLAVDTQLPGDPQCVVKQLKPQTADLATARRLFDREATTLHELGQGHDQIPRLFAHFEENEEFYLVEDYYEGETLGEEIQRLHRFREPQAIALLQDILSVLKYVHSHNVIHRDIKPSNIIRRKGDGKLTLIDFGVVKLIGVANLSGFHTKAETVAVSTLGYTPPEQQNGHPRLNSDIYALGVTVIKALTGKDIKDLQMNLHNWREQVQVSDELAGILDHMVRLDFQQRYQSVEEVLRDLEAMVEAFKQTTQVRTGVREPTESATQVRETEVRETEVRATQARATQARATQAQETALRPAPTPVSRPEAPIKGFAFKPWHVVAIAGVAAAAALFGGWKLYEPYFYLQQAKEQLVKYQPEKALDTFNRLIDNKSNDAAAWRGRGDALLALARYESALSAYDKALQLQPKDAKTLNKKGETLYELQRYQDSLDTHEQALKVTENNPEAWYGKGRAFIGLKRYEDALAAFDKAREMKPQSPSVWYSKGIALEYLNRRSEALKIYEEAVETYDEQLKANPNNLKWWVERGSVLSKLGRFNDVLNSAEKALKVDPDFYPALVLKGNALRVTGKADEALQAYNKAMEIRPEDYMTLHNRGTLLAEKGDFVQGIKSFDKALEIRSSFSPAWVDRGIALSQNNQQKEAIESFDKALRYAPKDAQALVGRGISLSALNRNEEALAAFEQAKEIEPNDPFVWANRAAVLENLKRNDEALKSYDEAIRLKPDFQSAIEARQKLRQKL